MEQLNDDLFGHFEIDIDTLTDEVLNLSREFRPLRLASDTTINSKISPSTSVIYIDDNTE